MIAMLSRAEVIAKYSPISDPLWTPEIEAEFFLNLPKRTHTEISVLDCEKGILLREFAKHTLHAKRMSAGYVSTVGEILGKFADSDSHGGECLISQRTEQLGSGREIRTIQAQLFNAGFLVNETRSQGKGFVGKVFVYYPKPHHQYRKATRASLEESYRRHEGESNSHQMPTYLQPRVIPF
jgi:hypothetical protein